MTDHTRLRMSILSASFTGLIIVGAFISVPLPFTPVPIVLQNFFVLLAGLLLGWRWGALSVALYLILGAVGLPVFSAARGGLGHFFGPTGGYLLGFLACALIAGALRRPGRSPAHNAPAGLLAMLAIYAVGVPWLKQVTEMSWGAALGAGIVPFLVGDAVKLAAALATQRVVTARIPWMRDLAGAATMEAGAPRTAEQSSSPENKNDGHTAL